MKFDKTMIPGLRVTVMGLGLNGGGLESVRFFAQHGAVLTVTDLREEEILRPSMEELEGFKLRYVLGKHELEDFTKADMVIKNPAVKWDSPFIKAAKRIETDISVFLKLNERPIIGVTGSKGKSTTVSALHFALQRQFPEADLGGNITCSPLSFIDRESDDPVVLELSSWQLGDLQGQPILDPAVALVTNIMHDHMDHYASADEYAADKEKIFSAQSPEGYTICNYNDHYGRKFYQSTPGRGRYFSNQILPPGMIGAYLDGNKGFYRWESGLVHLLDEELAIMGDHNRLNLLCAGLCAYLYGADPHRLRRDLSEFKGIPHRMERVREYRGISFYNDSAATIPQASMLSLNSFPDPVHVICGGRNKDCDFSGFPQTLKRHQVYLLEGSATDILIKGLKEGGVPYRGPFSSMKEAFEAAYENLKEGDTLILSPGAASFGMFLNEFDRGNQFKELVNRL